MSVRLDKAGLVWQPEIGDEIVVRESPEKISILVDPCGLTPAQLRNSYLWIPRVEQLVNQFEARKAIIYHVGATNRCEYQVVAKYPAGVIDVEAPSLRVAFGLALEDLLQSRFNGVVH
jgi:hypothetical protein